MSDEAETYLDDGPHSECGSSSDLVYRFGRNGHCSDRLRDLAWNHGVLDKGNESGNEIDSYVIAQSVLETEILRRSSDAF